MTASAAIDFVSDPIMNGVDPVIRLPRSSATP